MVNFNLLFTHLDFKTNIFMWIVKNVFEIVKSLLHSHLRQKKNNKNIRHSYFHTHIISLSEIGLTLYLIST